MTRLALVALIAGMAVSTCARPDAAKPEKSEEAVPNPSLAEQIGRVVTLEGTARDAKAGAIVLLDEGGEAVYVEGLASWPKTVHGRRVRATGTLRSRKKIPDPGSDPITAGAFGEQLVLEGARWEAAE